MTEDATLRSVLENARRELLDLSMRNRLLSTSRGSGKSTRLEIVDELSNEVFRHLVTEKKSMSFLPVPKEDEEDDQSEDAVLSQPDEEEVDNGELAARHIDDKLQTRLSSEKLQRKLLKLAYDAKSYEEEQGVNILYLALGFLKWYEDDKSDRERFAPLLLVPVALERQSAAAKFKIRSTDDDVITNLSLQSRMMQDFGIKLPDLSDADEINPNEYFEQACAVVRGRSRWEVLPNDIVLWFFSFSKFLMYRDLDAENWPEGQSLHDRQLIRSLLREGFGADPPICSDEAPIDSLISPIDMVHVLDADSSQAVVIEEVKRGRNLVVQGPPGTGKSQTIANVIAAAVKAGKTVLFVAEKMAALEVVQRRLANRGLGEMCLELHSHKANKRAVLQDLERTLQLGRPQVEDVERHCQELNACRESLNRHLQMIHSPLAPSGLTPFQVVGELVRLRATGTRPPEFRLEGALHWTRPEFQTRLGLLRDLVDRVDEVGIPREHAWRGVELDVVLPTDVDRITNRLPQIESRIRRLIEAGKVLAAMLGVSVPTTVIELSKLARMAQRMGAAPPMDRRCLANAVWREQRSQIDGVVETGQQFAAQQAELAGVVADIAWETDVTAARRDLAAYGRSWLRFLRRAYREAQATLRGILVVELPGKLESRLAILDGLVRGRKARALLSDGPAAEIGRQAFGSRWAGAESNWGSLAAVSRWEWECREGGIDESFRVVFASLNEVPDFRPILRRIRADLNLAVNELKDLFKTLRLNLHTAFGASDRLSIPMEALSKRLNQWRQQREALSHWVNYHTRRCRLASKGLAELAEQIDSGATKASEAVSRCEMAFYEELIRDAFRSNPELATFNGSSHEQVLQKFRKLDKARIEIARHEVALAHFERLPKAGSGVGEVGLVLHEIQKKRRHLPIRQLLAKAGRAVQAIKPVFMMSPISVAQYLEPGIIDFDLLLIDEASQVQPVDALGAIARARQLVVVGDSKQLPPTTFFQRMLGEDAQDADSYEEMNAGDMESILGLCCARNVSQRMLSWHYRSRHHSLIAVSNHEFYDDRLYVIPSPGRARPGQGLVFQQVTDGKFDRGGSATNRVEASVVAEAVMEHARKCPDKSLGVGTFSVAQRDAVLDELELLRRANPSLEHFFVGGAAEPFFIKNLENIQGDERDVIFISVGYGKDESGYMAMNFGPLSNEGGERRLNVLITRARECCTVFSSILADDIDTTRARARGAQALKTFLTYADSGLLDTGTFGGGEHDSEFERQVAKALATQGYETHPQVGVAGFFIDLAVVDPEQPGRYLLGIECDGANYHRSRSARDRDRLRQDVLEDRGWIIHRIWSTDWFHRPEEQLRKVVGAIETSKIELAGCSHNKHEENSQPAVERQSITRQENNGADCEVGHACPTQPYVVASFRIQANQEIHELPLVELAHVVVQIVHVEGPIHREEVARRVTQLWGLKKTGKRIRESVDQALEAAWGASIEVLDGDFFIPRGKNEWPVRDRGDVVSSTLRRPEMLPPVEIREAMTAIVQVHLGVTPDEAIIETARLFGFRSTSVQLKQVIEREMTMLLNNGVLEERNGKVYVAAVKEHETPFPTWNNS